MAGIKKPLIHPSVRWIRPVYRILIALLFSIFTYFLVPHKILDWKLLVLVEWIVFSTIYMLLSWWLFLNFDSEQVRIHASQEDGTRVFVFFAILISSFAGLFAVGLMLVSGPPTGMPVLIFILAILLSMLLSWSMVHTLFTFHYANLYFHKIKKLKLTGFEFPGDEPLDYLDFAYFSFVVGMTFQVSDVQVNTKNIRRQVLLHGLLSFILNTVVVALTFNLLAGLIHH